MIYIDVLAARAGFGPHSLVTLVILNPVHPLGLSVNLHGYHNKHINLVRGYAFCVDPLGVSMSQFSGTVAIHTVLAARGLECAN